MTMYKLYRVDSYGEKYLIGGEESLDRIKGLYEEACKYGFKGQKIILEKLLIETIVINEHLFV